METKNFDEQEILASLNEVKQALEEGVFEGIIIISKGADIDCHFRGGTMSQPISVLDFLCTMMLFQKEKGNEDGYNYFLNELVKRTNFLLNKRNI